MPGWASSWMGACQFIRDYIHRYPYLIALLGVSLFFVLVERLRPVRKRQRVFRRQLPNDLFYLLFNGHFYVILAGGVLVWAAERSEAWLGSLGLLPERRLLDDQNVVVQFVVFLVVSDFLQWCIHSLLLHRVPWLWQFHKLHHSVKEMDWAANFRFHWMEVVVYKSLLYIPLFCWLGGSYGPLMSVYVFATVWGHFNHSNVHIGLGPLAYVLNSPRMHMWHHDKSDEGGVFKNFGIVFSMWDFLFQTAYWPQQRAPKEIGYPGEEEMPRDLPRQLVFPLWRAE